MRILILHQNRFDRLAYDRAIDHAAHDVVYAGTAEYVANVPDHVRCRKVTLDGERPVADQLAPWLEAEAPFDRVLTRHELLVAPAAELRARFGIPGMRPEQALGFRDKVAMKTRVAQAGIRVPRHRPADALEPALPWHGRTIVKPRGGAGSKGVYLCDSVADARAVIEAEQRSDPGFAQRYEVEEYLDGPIWHVDGYIFRGEAVAVQAARYLNTCLDMEHGTPLGSVQRHNPDLESWALDCLRALGGGSLSFHLEAIETPEGPVFMEVAARCGGGYIVEMVRRRTGVYMHTVDMASDVADRLATWLIEAPSTDYHGMVLFPGHVYGGAPCEVRAPAALLEDPCVTTYQIYPAGTPTPTTGSYRPENLALAGMVTGRDPDRLEAWMSALFAEVEVRAQPAVGAP